MYRNDLYLNESIMSKPSELKRTAEDKIHLILNEEKIKGKKKFGKYVNNSMDDVTFFELRQCFNNMKKAKIYSEYRKWFIKMCKICLIPFDGCVIKSYNLSKGKTNKNIVKVVYVNTRQKLILPPGTELYHQTTIVDGPPFTSIKPFFQGKTAKGYMYNSPRIYLTTKQQMPKIFADIKQKENVRIYRVKSKIQTVYIDPLLVKSVTGAIYVETNFPLACELVKPELVKESINWGEGNFDLNNELNNEPENFVSLEEFCEYYGLILEDDDHITTESTLDIFGVKIGDISRKYNDKMELNNIMNTSFLMKKDINVDKHKKKVLQETFKSLNNKSISVYKKKYNELCSFFNIDKKMLLSV